MIVTFAALGVYFLAQAACIVFFWRRHEFHPIWHGTVPLAAMAVIVYLFIKSEFPTRPHPLNLALWIAVAWTLVGLVIVAVLSVIAPRAVRADGADHHRRRTGRAARARGRVNDGARVGVSTRELGRYWSRHYDPNGGQPRWPPPRRALPLRFSTASAPSS